MEEMGQRYVMEIPKIVTGWCRRPEVIEEEFRGEGDPGRPRNMPRMADGTKAARAVHRLVRRSSVFRQQGWATYRVKDSQRGPEVWSVKVGVFYQHRDGLPSKALRLMVAENVLTGEIKYFLSDAAEDVPVETLLRVAFSRWRIERCFEDYKGELGMDHFEVRKWTAIRRHFAVSLVSGLFLETECMRIREKKSVDIRLSDSESGQCPDRNDSVYAQGTTQAVEPGCGGNSGNPKTQRRILPLAQTRTTQRITSRRNSVDENTALRRRQKVALSC
jgi:SRSO17 transposase